MGVKVKLEKDGYVKNGFVGYSWTSTFLGFWVPSFRQNFDGFIIFFIVYLIQMMVPLFIQVYALVNIYDPNMVNYLNKIVYLNYATYFLSFLMGAWYNKYYTKKLLQDGWKPLENDEYSSAILKAYRYIAYTDAELMDSDKIQRYSTFLNKVKKAERNKFFIFLAIIVIIICLAYVSAKFN